MKHKLIKTLRVIKKILYVSLAIFIVLFFAVSIQLALTFNPVAMLPLGIVLMILVFLPPGTITKLFFKILNEIFGR